jgi:hypothetical protein
MLKAGLFLEIEMGAKEKGVPIYLKVVTPFHVLCRVAEVVGLLLPLKVNYSQGSYDSELNTWCLQKCIPKEQLG